MEKKLHEQLAEMDLHGMSKCELLNELCGTECHTSRTGSTDDVTPCKEHRERQREALIRRILDEYGHKEVKPVLVDEYEVHGFPIMEWECPECGERLYEGMNYCPMCDAKLVWR